MRRVWILPIQVGQKYLKPVYPPTIFKKIEIKVLKRGTISELGAPSSAEGRFSDKGSGVLPLDFCAGTLIYLPRLVHLLRTVLQSVCGKSL